MVFLCNIFYGLPSELNKKHIRRKRLCLIRLLADSITQGNIIPNLLSSLRPMDKKALRFYECLQNKNERKLLIDEKDYDTFGFYTR